MYQVCAVGHILLYSCKVTQFPEILREFSFFSHFPDILYLEYTSLNSPISERARL